MWEVFWCVLRFFAFQATRSGNNNVQATPSLWALMNLHWKELELFTHPLLSLCSPHKNTHTVTAFFIQEKKNSELPCHFLDFIKHTQTFQHWVSYLHVIPAYWYSTKGNIPSSVKKITMKQSKIILAEIPEWKKSNFFDLMKHIPKCSKFKPSLNAALQLIQRNRKERTDSFSKFLKRMLIPSSLNGSTLSDKDSVNRPCYCKQLRFLPLLLKLLTILVFSFAHPSTVLSIHIAPVFFLHSKLRCHQNSFKVNALEYLYFGIYFLCYHKHFSMSWQKLLLI